MSPKEKLQMLVNQIPTRPVKIKNVKETLHWDDALDLHFPNYPKEIITSKNRKIYEAIVGLVDKDTNITARDYVYWFVENYTLLTGKHMPSITLFNLSYKEHLAKFIKSKEKKSFRVRR